LINRKNFVEASANLVGMVENNDLKGYLCATTMTTLDYLISKATNKNQAKTRYKNCSLFLTLLM